MKFQCQVGTLMNWEKSHQELLYIPICWASPKLRFLKNAISGCKNICQNFLKYVLNIHILRHTCIWLIYVHKYIYTLRDNWNAPMGRKWPWSHGFCPLSQTVWLYAIFLNLWKRNLLCLSGFWYNSTYGGNIVKIGWGWRMGWRGRGRPDDKSEDWKPGWLHL